MRVIGAVLACAVALSPLTAYAQPQSVAGQEPVRAEYASDGPDRATVVVYRDQPLSTVDMMARSRERWRRLDLEGLALIVEKRTIEVPAGDGVIRFKGLGSGIVPHSATIEGLPARLIEQNADYNLISPANLLEQSIGQTVTLVRTNASNGEEVHETGILRSGRLGAVVQIGDRFEALDCSGLTERLVFEDVPEGLGATPTLSILTRAEQAGRYEVTLAYLTTGLQWAADYVANLSEDGSQIALQGWITLANFGNTTFSEAPVIVVAGDLNRDADTRPVTMRAPGLSTTCWPQMRTHEGLYADDYGGYPPPPPPPAPPPPPVAAAPAMMRMAEDVVVTGSRVMARQEELGDYKAYVIPHLTTVAARQTKQVLFLDQPAVPFERIYSFSLMPTHEAGSPATVIYKLRNEVEQGLGIPVPQGNAVLMLPDRGAGRLLGGSQSIEDTPVGLPIRWQVGTNMDVVGKITQAAVTSSGYGPRRRVTETYRIELINSSPNPVRIEVDQPNYQFLSRSFRMEREDVESRIDPDRGTRVWTLDLVAGAERTFEVRWSYNDPV